LLIKIPYSLLLIWNTYSFLLVWNTYSFLLIQWFYQYSVRSTVVCLFTHLASQLKFCSLRFHTHFCSFETLTHFCSFETRTHFCSSNGFINILFILLLTDFSLNGFIHCLSMSKANAHMNKIFQAHSLKRFTSVISSVLW
jgi:hypothetical protein